MADATPLDLWRSATAQASWTLEDAPPVWTPWLESEEPDPRHEKFKDLVQRVATANYPWLPELVRQANGMVVASVGHFAVMLDGVKPIEIPELSASLTLTPWADEGEAVQ